MEREKELVAHIDGDLSSSQRGEEPTWDEEEETRLRHKIDRHIVPLVTLLYMLCFLDRINIGNAFIQGMREELDLARDFRFNWALSIFYIIYLLVEVPSNIILKRVGARFYLPFLVLGFGIVTMCMAFVKSFAGLMVARAVLGVFEGGAFPGIAFFLSSFYKREELLFRVGIFVSAASMAGAFGGLLATGLSRIPAWGTGAARIDTWRNIFFFEGIITIIVAFAAPLWLPSSPATSKFLDEREKWIAMERLTREQKEKPTEKVEARHVKRAFLCIHNYTCALGFFLINITVQGLSVFMPAILADLGWKNTKAQLLTVPPYVAACLIAIAIAYISDKTKKRGIYLAVFSLIALTGFALLRFYEGANVRYMAIFFVTTGAFPGGPAFISWAMNNTGGSAVRAVSSSWVVTLGTIGGIVATWTYITTDAPKYPTGHSINLGGQIAVFFLSVFGILYCLRENRLRAKGKRDHRLEGLTEAEQQDLGYRHPEFRTYSSMTDNMKRYLTALLASVALAADIPDGAEQYDFIVVGSGPGGGPLAANLARAGFSTLLLEAGEDHGDDSMYREIANFNAAGNDERTRWDFFVKHSDDPERELKFERMTWRTAEGEFYVGLEPPEGAEQLGIYYPRAGTLGGCAQHNAGVASLPTDAEWEYIVEITGDETWSPASMRGFFEQTETNLFVPEGTEGHGFNGWMQVSAPDANWARAGGFPADNIVKKLAELTGQDTENIPELLEKDIFEQGADNTTSFYSMARHADKLGRRSSPNNYIKATLADDAEYPLTVQLNSLVAKVLFDEDAEVPTAIGVEVLQGPSLYRADPRHDPEAAEGNRTRVYARHEVIVSGGAFNSPQILKLSGVGPREELEALDIPVVVDLPGVGENLGDNYEGDLLALGRAPTGGGFVTTLLRTESAPTADRNIYTWCGAFSFEGFWPGFPEDYGANQYECAIVHMSPKSQAGSVKLVTADPRDVPDINFRFFENEGEQDLQEILDAMKLLRESWQVAGDAVLPYDEKSPCPGTSAGKDCTDEEQRERIKNQAYSHHATSTCAIGADDDELAVLDSKFRVRGVQGLRVVDASAWPKVPGAFPVLPTAMLSMKASHEIISSLAGEGAAVEEEPVAEEPVVEEPVEEPPVEEEPVEGPEEGDDGSDE
ncbi:related to permease of the major facilitator superfamily [Cephalotrichum gorgonifer]|uniref:Related to permease of the major facilitator superfamily n=1 Tax=Cephalotrichum gorgonifer TaxID=2041049 RepID=A0AAE8N0R3_9PEZI|nr:related to permease of the major facilitator superfamily [Cephalotrichum gorgonifer]